jgi:hypothetical protein
MNSLLMTANNEIAAIILAINNDIGKIVEKHLTPHFEAMLLAKHNMKLVESVLRQMPDFKRLESENEALRRELENKQTPQNIRVPDENIIKLEIVEKTTATENVVSVTDIYTVVELSSQLKNTINKTEVSEDEDEAASEIAASEAADEEEEEAASEADQEEASEAVEEEEEEEAEEAASEAVEEEEAASEAEEEEVEEEEAEEASEAEEAASEAEQEEAEEEAEEASEAEQEEASEAEEEKASEAEEAAPEPAAQAEEDEVFIIEIKGRGKFYTNNETNGDIYQIDGEDDVGDQVGKFTNKVAKFFKA